MLDGCMPWPAFSCCAMATCIFGVDICGVCYREMRKQNQTRQKTPIKSLCCCPVLSIVVRLSTRTSLLCAQTALKSAGNVPTGLYNKINLQNLLVTTVCTLRVSLQATRPSFQLSGRHVHARVARQVVRTLPGRMYNRLDDTSVALFNHLHRVSARFRGCLDCGDQLRDDLWDLSARHSLLQHGAGRTKQHYRCCDQQDVLQATTSHESLIIC